ncbi:MAG: ArnT family glycosyltransferase [Nitrospinaceae bacterium]
MLNNRTFLISFLLFSSVLIFLGRQLDVGLPNFDDAYYAQKAKEMLASGNLWVVTHHGVPDFANPPFPFWMTALAFWLFGVSGYAAVFFSALFGVGTVYLTYLLCLHLFKDPWTAFFSAFVLLFPGMFADSARRAMVDITLAFCVTAAMFFFVKAQENRRFYLLYGIMTALGILTKSILGLFPLMIGFAVLLWTRNWKELFNTTLWAGVSIALIFGFSWHGVNWFVLGDDFLKTHFGVLLFNRGFSGTGGSFYFLGYARDFAKNYWPWLPFAVVGLVKFGKRAFVEKDFSSLLVLTWIAVVFLVMSTSKNQTLRYLFMIFPALAIVTAKTIADGLQEKTRERWTPYALGLILVAVLFVNVTPFQVKVMLSPNSVEVRQLAAVIHLNTPRDQRVGNYRLSMYNPRQALLFYSERYLDDPVGDPSVLLEQMKKRPGSTWLTPVSEFNRLKQAYSGKFYLIQANGRYAYFTSAGNRENIRYDFSGMSLPLVR